MYQSSVHKCVCILFAVLNKKNNNPFSSLDYNKRGPLPVHTTDNLLFAWRWCCWCWCSSGGHVICIWAAYLFYLTNDLTPSDLCSCRCHCYTAIFDNICGVYVLFMRAAHSMSRYYHDGMQSFNWIKRIVCCYVMLLKPEFSIGSRKHACLPSFIHHTQHFILFTHFHRPCNLHDRYNTRTPQ